MYILNYVSNASNVGSIDKSIMKYGFGYIISYSKYRKH